MRDSTDRDSIYSSIRYFFVDVLVSFVVEFTYHSHGLKVAHLHELKVG